MLESTRPESPRNTSDGSPYLAAASAFFQVRRGALVTIPALRALTETRVKAILPSGEVRYMRVSVKALKAGLVTKAPRRTWKKADAAAK